MEKRAASNRNSFISTDVGKVPGEIPEPGCRWSVVKNAKRWRRRWTGWVQLENGSSTIGLTKAKKDYSRYGMNTIRQTRLC